MLANLEDFDPQQSVRDRLFDTLMLRFEALEPYRSGVRAMFADVVNDVFSVPRSAISLSHSMSAALEASGLDSGTLSGRVKAHALSIIWYRTFQTWLEDDAELSKTMAQLDRDLRRAEGLVNSLERNRARTAKGSAA